MSTTVTEAMTVAETKETTSPPKLGFSIHILKTKDGILKILELLITITCLTMYFRRDIYFGTVEIKLAGNVLCNMCFLTSAFPTLLLLMSYLISPMATILIPKTFYDVVHSGIASLFYLINSMVYLIFVAEFRDILRTEEQDPDDPVDSTLLTGPPEMAVGVMAFTNGILYLFSAYFSYLSFKSP